MGSDYGKRRAVCPYYIKDRDRRIVCEGWTEGVNGQTNHRSEDDKIAYMDRYCNSQAWETCAMAIIAGAKYEEQ